MVGGGRRNNIYTILNRIAGEFNDDGCGDIGETMSLATPVSITTISAASGVVTVATLPHMGRSRTSFNGAKIVNRASRPD